MVSSDESTELWQHPHTAFNLNEEISFMCLIEICCFNPMLWHLFHSQLLDNDQNVNVSSNV